MGNEPLFFSKYLISSQLTLNHKLPNGPFQRNNPHNFTFENTLTLVQNKFHEVIKKFHGKLDVFEKESIVIYIKRL